MSDTPMTDAMDQDLLAASEEARGVKFTALNFARLLERRLAQRPEEVPLGMVAVPVSFVEISKQMAEAVRWVLQDAAYKPPEEIGEVPQRWLQAIVDGLASKVAYETPAVDMNLMPVLEQRAAVSLQRAWDGDNDGSPTFINPGIGAYTK